MAYSWVWSAMITCASATMVVATTTSLARAGPVTRGLSNVVNHHRIRAVTAPFHLDQAIQWNCVADSISYREMSAITQTADLLTFVLYTTCPRTTPSNKYGNCQQSHPIGLLPPPMWIELNNETDSIYFLSFNLYYLTIFWVQLMLYPVQQFQ